MIHSPAGERIIRASALTGYADCPRRAAAKLFRPDIRAAGYELPELPSGIGAAMGTAVHSAAKVALDEVAKSGSLPPLSVATDAAQAVLHEGVKKGVAWEAKGITTAQAAEVVVQKMVVSYHEEIAPTIQPILVEERLEATVSSDSLTGISFVLSGQADVVAREPGKIRDLKTGKKRGAHGAQLGAYDLLAESNGLPIKEAAIDFIQRVGLKTAQPPAVVDNYDLGNVQQQALRVIAQAETDLRTFLLGNADLRLAAGDPRAFLSNPSSMLCSPKYCPAHGTPFCRDHAPVVDDE
ncbi:MAG: hypothetical protein EAZ99_07860 [Alphaproteobacteria bacterium]|nr:MAG: hypothetical protein EAZ99_07860 [Alphaproteobacteria bacterium]